VTRKRPGRNPGTSQIGWAADQEQHTGSASSNGTRERRDAYAACGAAHRAAYERAAAADLSRRDWRVFGAVMVLLPSWSRLSDKTSVRQVAAIVYGKTDYETVTGWERDKTSLALRHLARLGIIGYQPGRGHLARCLVSLPPSAIQPDTGRIEGQEQESTQPDFGGQHNPISEGNPAERVGTSENSSEDSTSEREKSGPTTTPSSERQTKPPEGFAKREERPEVTDALNLIAREAPAVLEGDGREQVRLRLRALRDPMFAACALTKAFRETPTINPVGRAIRYLSRCIDREAAA
jgi:hypothetical protein